MTEAFPIVDAHQHFWDPRVNYHPWLCDEPPIPFRYGDYRALRRPYLPADYLSDAGPCRIIATVYVETEWDPRDPIGEMNYVEGMRREAGLPTVAVAQAWLDRDDVAAVLERQAAFPFVRSIRHKPRANLSPADGAPGGMTDPRWGAGFALLGAERPAVRSADAVVAPARGRRAGSPVSRKRQSSSIIRGCRRIAAPMASRDGDAPWRRSPLARTRRSRSPVSAFRAHPGRWRRIGEIVLTTIDLFGVDRCMFASNFPVDGLCATFDAIFSGFREMVRDFTPGERAQLFHDNAVRIYGME